MARPGGCRVPIGPQGGALVLRPTRSGGSLGADPRWPGTCLRVTQPRVGNVVRRRRLRRPYAPPPPARGRAVQREAAAQALGRTGAGEQDAGAGKKDAGAGEEVGPGRGAQQREGPPPSGTELALGPGRRGGRAGQCAGGRRGRRAAARTGLRGCQGPSPIPPPFFFFFCGPQWGGREGAGPLGVVAAAPTRLCLSLVQAELRAEAPCWEAAPLVLVSGNRAPLAEPAGAGR